MAKRRPRWATPGRMKDARGRFVSVAKARAAREKNLHTALEALTRALAAVSPPHDIVRGGLYSNQILFRRVISWDALTSIMLAADLDKVQKYDRLRYHICGIDAQWRVQPLSRAYASAELSLGEATANLNEKTIQSPKDDGDDEEISRWRGILVSVFLRKDASR